MGKPDLKERLAAWRWKRRYQRDLTREALAALKQVRAPEPRREWLLLRLRLKLDALRSKAGVGDTDTTLDDEYLSREISSLNAFAQTGLPQDEYAAWADGGMEAVLEERSIRAQEAREAADE